MKTFKRFLRYFLYALVVVLAAAVGALVVLTTTERGRDNLAGMISTLASSDDSKVTIAKIDGIWSGRLRVGSVTLADGQGPWLALRDVAVDWSPLALLSKTFRADRVAVQRIEMARLPQSSGKTDAGASSGGGSGLPVSVDVKQIDLPDIALGEDLAGTGIAELAAKAALKADASPMAIATDLNIQRRDGQQGSVVGSVHFAPADNKLDVDLKASEPAGGIIANLLRIPDAPPVDIAVKGNGPLGDWNGAGSFSVAGQVVAQLSGRHQLTDAGSRIEVKGDGAFERFLPDMLKPLLTGQSRFDIAGTATKAGGVEIERAAIDSDAIHAEAKGAFDPESAADISAQVTARSGPVVLSLPTGGAPVTVAVDNLTARAFGDGKEPMVDVAGSFVSVVTGGTEIRDLGVQIHSDGFNVNTRSGPVKVGLEAGTLKSDVATLAPLVAGKVVANLSGTIGQDEITLDEGTLRSDALNASVTAKVTLADLAMTLAMNADAVSTALPQQIQTVLGPRVQFSATATRDPKGDFAANSIELKSGTLSASGTASATGTDLQADLKGSLGDVSVLSSLVGTPVAGNLDFALTAKGARTAPDFTVTAGSDSLTAAGKTVKAIKLSASGKADIASPSADVSLTGSVDEQPLELKAALTTTDGKRSVNGLSLSLGDSKISGDLALNDAFMPLGTLTLAVPDIAPLAELAGQSASGDINGTFAFSADGDVPSVAINAASGQITRGDMAARNIKVAAAVGSFIKAPAISGKITADSVKSGTTEIGGIAVDLKQDGPWTGFTGKATVAGIPATIDGRAKLANGTTTVELSSGGATVKGIDTVIDGPATITVANGQTSIDRLAVGLGGGSVVLSGTAGETLDLKAEISNLPAALGNAFVDGLDAAGRLDGTATVTGPSSAPVVGFDARLAGGETSQTRKLGLGALDLAASGSYVPGGAVDLRQATLSGEGVSGTAHGTFDPNGASDLTLDVKSSGDSLPLSLGTPESPIDLALQSLSARAVGPKNALKLDVGGALASLATKDVKANGVRLSLHSNGFDVDKRSGPLAGKASAESIVMENPTVAPLLAGRITADFSGGLGEDVLTIASAKLHGDALDGTADGRVSLADGSIALNLGVDALSAALPAAARGVLAERTKLLAAINRDAKGNLAVDGLKLASGALDASGKASLTDGTLAATLQGALADLSLLSKDAAGVIRFDVQASGPTAAPDLSLTVDSDRMTVANREITGLKLSASGKADMANPAADLTLAGTVAGQQLKGNAVLKTTDGRREIDGLSLSLGPNSIRGDLVLDDAFLPEGDIALDLPDIGPLAALALEKAEGDVRGTIRFSKQEGKPQVSVQAKSAKITRGDLAVNGVGIDALVADYTGTPTISGTVHADSVNSGGTAVTGINIDLKRDGEWTGFSGGATVKDIPAKASGRVRVADGATTVELKSGEATFKGVKASIAQPSTIAIKDGVTTLEKIVIGVGGGTATVTGSAGQTLDVNVALAGVPVSVANNFASGLDADGALSGTVKVTGEASAPKVAYDIKGTGIALAPTRSAGFGGIGVTSSGTFAANKLDFTANATEGSGMNLKAGGTVTTAGTPNLAIDVSGGVPFNFLAAKLSQMGLSLNGAANVDISVRGPASKPDISGSVRTSGARFIDSSSGLSINNIAADVMLGGGVARINSVTGTLSTRGTLSVSGTVGIEPGSGFPADIAVKLDNGRYTDGRVVTANLSGALAIKGPLATTPAISGTIDLGRTVITVPDRLPSSLSTLNVKHRNAPAAVRAQDRALNPPSATNSGGNGGLTLDITVNAPNQIFIQGRGVDAELGGRIRLTGPASAPEAVGKFELQRGRLSVLAKRLTFTEGSATFSGSLIPYLNLTAESTAGDATVTITVSGEATDPKFTFSSVPALPEDEVLARLIFGRSMSNLSPLQIAQLAEAAAQLSGVGGSTSLLEKLRGQLGVDDLDVTTDEQGGTAVSAGKYLNDRTYLSIQKGEKPGSGRARIDFNVGKGVKLRGEASDAGEAKGGIFYEHEY
ncbi:translocation/assembly module TamB domain-containing protein [Mesorhizobium sp. CN5-321]|uniref:translocation/assembly module TamB domain-containing protein n=1 Tax=Mesorhizobium hunchu TaxID=3157708 RepID=UPI0032B7F46A